MVAPVAASIADLSRITVPTLVLSGDRDSFCPPEMAVTFHRAIADSELAIIPGTGHEITQPLIDCLTSFLIRHR